MSSIGKQATVTIGKDCNKSNRTSFQHLKYLIKYHYLKKQVTSRKTELQAVDTQFSIHNRPKCVCYDVIHIGILNKMHKILTSTNKHDKFSRMVF